MTFTPDQTSLPPAGTPVLLSWSGGKDSAMTLRALRTAGLAVRGLLTTITADVDRISMHGVRRELLAAQAASLGLPVWPVTIPQQADNETYNAAMGQALDQARAAGIGHIAFGDLLLADVRAHREEQTAAAGLEAVFPLWGRDTAAFASEVLAAGVQARLVCVDAEAAPAQLLGCAYDQNLLDGLPPSVDPAGENGEFHTFVSDGPDFERPVGYTVGDRVDRGQLVFVDLVPAADAAPADAGGG